MLKGEPQDGRRHPTSGAGLGLMMEKGMKSVYQVSQ